MTLGLERFRSLSGDRFTAPMANNARTVQKDELKWSDRVRCLFRSGDSFRHGTVAQQNDNKVFKQQFFQALVRAHGQPIADAAVQAAGLPNNWQTQRSAMSGKNCKAILDQVQQVRLGAMRTNDQSLNNFIRGTGPNALDGVLANTGRPPAGKDDPALWNAIKREMHTDGRYAGTALAPADLTAIATSAINAFYTDKEARFTEAHPGLALMRGHNLGNCPTEGKEGTLASLRSKLAVNHALSGEPDGFRDAARGALDAVETTPGVLTRMSYEPAGWARLAAGLDGQFDELQRAETALNALANTNGAPRTPEGQALLPHLITEVRHQKDLVTAKKAFLDDMMNRDPLSEVSVAYSDKLWAEAAGHVLDKAIASLNGQNPEAARTLRDAKAAYIQAKATDLQVAKGVQASAVQQRTAGPRAQKSGRWPGAEHPAAKGKADAKKRLEGALKSANFTGAQIKDLTSSKNLSAARQRALNDNQSWAPVRKDMVVSKDGVTRVYRSVITPGQRIDARFGRNYAAGQQAVVAQNGAPAQPAQAGSPGVSSATKADHYRARNLKISELQRVDVLNPGNPPHSVAKVVGHGVLDMWDIADPAQRRAANERGAREVLEAALSTNPRIRTEAGTRKAANNGAAPVKLTHVSVNLVTPAPFRENAVSRWLLENVARKDLTDYQELTYTKEQFRAFEANSSAPGRPTVPLTTVDNMGQDLDLDVEVDTIAFSFGINPLATGTFSALGGWSRVYDENSTAMLRFIGDFGSNPDEFRGQPPGGFVGGVYAHLRPNVPAEARLAARIREQTDTVRQLFTTKAFKDGNGDPAKMSREILALQGLAEEALALRNVVGEAATMSKGCKSDKDRGGVTDVELKHKLITDEMGGRIVPDEVLQGDDQENYYVVAAGSGQFENQQLNTGLPGSKEAAKLEARLPSQAVRQYLAGLGKFASE